MKEHANGYPTESKVKERFPFSSGTKKDVQEALRSAALTVEI